MSRAEDNHIEVEVYENVESFGLYASLSLVQATALARALIERIEEAMSIQEKERAPQ